MRPALSTAILLAAIGVMPTAPGETRAAAPRPPEVPPYPDPMRSRGPAQPRPPTAAEIAADAKRRRRNANRLAGATR